jgi:glycosyltransferase involved in cell wall biosynthesis
MLSGAPHPDEDPPQPELDRQLQRLLDACTPTAIVSVGWADPAYQRLLIAAHQRRIPLVIVSDSRERDEPRSWPKELIKRQLLRGYSAALVAGSESLAYLDGLGFPPSAISQPWDVVDNGFFEAAAQKAGPRQPRFLCVSRLEAKKNHRLVLQAYGAYQRSGGFWGLQLVGSGPLGAAIRETITQLPDPSRVQLLPFAQLDPLARAYGEAGAFVLASHSDQWGLVVNEAMAAGLPVLVSRACGCAADLIEHGVSGWTFDPADPAALTTLMHTAERQTPAWREAMTSAARDRLSTFSPSSFAHGLHQALEWASAHPRFSRRAALMADLISRREPLR